MKWNITSNAAKAVTLFIYFCNPTATLVFQATGVMQSDTVGLSIPVECVIVGLVFTDILETEASLRVKCIKVSFVTRGCIGGSEWRIRSGVEFELSDLLFWVLLRFSYSVPGGFEWKQFWERVFSILVDSSVFSFPGSPRWLRINWSPPVCSCAIENTNSVDF